MSVTSEECHDCAVARADSHPEVRDGLTWREITVVRFDEELETFRVATLHYKRPESTKIPSRLLTQ